jgi:FkbH-like protein
MPRRQKIRKIYWMVEMHGLIWLPKDPDWKARLSALPKGAERWSLLQALANTDMDFVRTAQLDRRLLDTSADAGPRPLRLALLSSGTVDQLVPSVRVAALRKGIRLDVHVPDYGQYRQALLDPESSLSAYSPDVVLLAIDAWAFVGHEFIADSKLAEAHLSLQLEELTRLWRVARDRFGAQIIQQTFLPTIPLLLGAAEHRALGSPAAMINAANSKLRDLAVAEDIDLLTLDERLQRDGLDAWHSRALWNRAKQDVSPAASPMYGELVLRIVGARRGYSAKCLVLDLDNTLWGGVVGDDGIEGIALGQGSAEGESYLQFQSYAKALAQRGIILAVCSKNDEANALEVFEKHPEMVLRRADIAAFFANWDDKATNLRRIARELNIGIDAIVFADDNPFERNIIRRELPTVRVPELPEDPALFAETISDAGYFEAVDITQEDLARSASYKASQALRQHSVATSDLEGYLASLGMEIRWGKFGPMSLRRVTQLINKTNQFNLTTRRYTDDETASIVDDVTAIGLHLRLVDKYADHGIIAVIIGRRSGLDTLEIDTWLMSCRVLGRGVEKATLAILINEAVRDGYQKIIGRYCPTPKNGMVRDLYSRLGFVAVDSKDNGETTWMLDPIIANMDTPCIQIAETVDG